MQAQAPGPVVPERYVDAVGKRDPIELMTKAAKRLGKLLDGRSEKELEWRPAPGQWSVKEVLAHLSDGEVIIGSRLRFVAAMDRPTIVGYDQDAFVARLGVEGRSAEECLDEFRSMRAINVALLSRLPKDAFARIGLHSERGEESLGYMVRLYAGHDLVHEAQIGRQLAAYKADKKARRARAEEERRAAEARDKAERKAAKAARAAKQQAKRLGKRRERRG
jgi:hypothetical protein